MSANATSKLINIAIIKSIPISDALNGLSQKV